MCVHQDTVAYSTFMCAPLMKSVALRGDYIREYDVKHDMYIWKRIAQLLRPLSFLFNTYTCIGVGRLRSDSAACNVLWSRRGLDQVIITRA